MAVHLCLARHDGELRAAGGFAYTDPADGWVSRNQGIPTLFADGAHCVPVVRHRHSRGDAGVYIERFEPDPPAVARTRRRSSSP